MEIQLKSQFYFCFVLPVVCLCFFFFNRAFLHDHSQVTLVFRSLNKANKTINSIQFNLVYNSYFFQNSRSTENRDKVYLMSLKKIKFYVFLSPYPGAAQGVMGIFMLKGARDKRIVVSNMSGENKS